MWNAICVVIYIQSVQLYICPYIIYKCMWTYMEICAFEKYRNMCNINKILLLNKKVSIMISFSSTALQNLTFQVTQKYFLLYKFMIVW